MHLSLENARRSYARLRSDLKAADLGGMLSLSTGLRAFLREPVTLERATGEITRALENREETFLDLVRAEIYDRAESPYLKLLRTAGCEFSDLRACVQRHGLEKTLAQLAGEGVYLTADEFKGKKEVIRSGKSFSFSPGEFKFSRPTAGFVTTSSGTRNRPLSSVKSVDWLVTSAILRCIFYSAHDLFSRAHAIYDAILPATGGVSNLLVNAKLGITTERWFARRIPVYSSMEGAYHFLTTYLVVLVGKWFGPGVPRPEFIGPEEVGRIVSWIRAKRDEGKLCCVRTAASNAARIAQQAAKMGVSLEGTKFVVSGEPFTESKHDLLVQVGATATTSYGGSGSGSVGYGCANPLHIDEIHVFQHRLGVIPNPKPVALAEVSIHPLLFTSLPPSSSRLLFNVENGDYATLDRRNCGCALEKAGLTLHLHHIRSHEKFTSEGMNYFYGDLFDLFENVLPAEFGGGPGDYQLAEEEDHQGQTRLSLIVNPAVGELDEEKLLARLRAALSQGSRGNRFMSELWQNAGTFRVVRKAPHASPRGKILPLHISR